MKRNFRRQTSACLAAIFTLIVLSLLLNCHGPVKDFSRNLDKEFDRKNRLCYLKRILSSFVGIADFQRYGQRRNLRGKIDDIVLIYWTRIFGGQVRVGDPKSWPHFYTGKHCPVNCTLTTNHSMLDEASAVVVHARNIEEMPPQDTIHREKIRWILHSNENPAYTPALTNSKIMSKFNFYLSYRLDSDFPLSLFQKPQLSPQPVPFKKKSKTLAVAMYSHCETIRTVYLVQLMRHIQVDSYGACLHNTELPHRFTARRFHNSANFSIELYKNYKFTIVFMNSDCDYFVDEKLYHALTAGSVPIFMGSHKIYEFLPGNLAKAIIDVRDFETPKLLADYLKVLAEDEVSYNRYLKWKYEGYNFPATYRSSPIGRWWDDELPLFCRICVELRSGNMGRNGLQPETCPRRKLTDWINLQKFNQDGQVIDFPGIVNN